MRTSVNSYSDNELKKIWGNLGCSNDLIEILLKEYNMAHCVFLNDCEGNIEEAEKEEEKIFKNITFDFVNEFYTKPIQHEIKKGHSLDWAYHYVDCTENCDDEKNYHAYTEIAKKNENVAINELLVYCKYKKNDEKYTEYYIFMFKSGEGYNKPSEIAKKYSENYKKQIMNNKSELFAHTYAENAIDDYTDATCYSYAYMYEKNIKNGKSEEYANAIAYKYSDFVGNEYDSSDSFLKDLRDNDERLEWHYIQTMSYINAWEHCRKNKIENQEDFKRFYEITYQNEFYGDFGISNEKLHEFVIKKYNEHLQSLNKV